MKKMKLYAVISPLCILFAQSALTVQAQKIDDSELQVPMPLERTTAMTRLKLQNGHWMLPTRLHSRYMLLLV